MSETASPNPKPRSNKRCVDILRRPDFPEDENVVMHDDLRNLVIDSKDIYCAVTALVSLLRTESPDGLDSVDRRGLAELLFGIQSRAELVVDNMRCMAVTLGLPDARELA